MKTLKLAFATIRSAKLRAFLTFFGIVLASTLLSAFGFASDVLLSLARLPTAVIDALRLSLGAFTLLFVFSLAVGLSRKKKRDA